MIYTITSQRSGTLYSHYVVTIFNQKGNDFAEFVLYYDKLTKIKSIKAFAYDASGEVLKKLKASEIYDQSVYSSGTMFSDNRLKKIDLTQASYPYTIEIEYEKEYNFLFNIDDSYIIPDEDVSVEYASYQLIYPPNLKPRYKTRNISVKPLVGQGPTPGTESIKWTFNHLLPIKNEPYSPFLSQVPYIDAAPSTFEYDSYVGDMSSWENFGKWISMLNKDRDQLPMATLAKIQQITAKAKTTEEKVKILYEYLQSKTRYVSVQLGIGGYQPFNASVVDQNGYGDCKALSNYMVSMLSAIGIKANYALIYAGSWARPLDVDFPSSQFNHAIVAVPNESDTIWLECTSQTNPFGFQGSFTGDRKALLITDKGGQVVNTTRYSAEQNVRSRSAVVKLDATGNATARVITKYQGLEYENHGLGFALAGKPDEQKEWIQENTTIPSFNLAKFSMVNDKSKMPMGTVSAEYVLTKYAALNGKRIFVVPNLMMNRKNQIPESVTDRKTPVQISRAFVHHDTIRFEIPDSIYPEALPQPITIKSKFGEYSASFTTDQGSLLYVRKLKTEKGLFAPETYNEFVEFYKNVSKADNTKVVFLNKT